MRPREELGVFPFHSQRRRSDGYRLRASALGLLRGGAHEIRAGLQTRLARVLPITHEGTRGGRLRPNAEVPWRRRSQVLRCWRGQDLEGRVLAAVGVVPDLQIAEGGIIRTKAVGHGNHCDAELARSAGERCGRMNRGGELTPHVLAFFAHRRIGDVRGIGSPVLAVLVRSPPDKENNPVNEGRLKLKRKGDAHFTRRLDLSRGLRGEEAQPTFQTGSVLRLPQPLRVPLIEHAQRLDEEGTIAIRLLEQPTQRFGLLRVLRGRPRQPRLSHLREERPSVSRLARHTRPPEPARITVENASMMQPSQRIVSLQPTAGTASWCRLPEHPGFPLRDLDHHPIWPPPDAPRSFLEHLPKDVERQRPVRTVRRRGRRRARLSRRTCRLIQTLQPPVHLCQRERARRQPPQCSRSVGLVLVLLVLREDRLDLA